MRWSMERYQPRWAEVKERFEAWWKRSSCGRPLMRVLAKRDKPRAPRGQAASAGAGRGRGLRCVDLVPGTAYRLRIATRIRP